MQSKLKNGHERCKKINAEIFEILNFRCEKMRNVRNLDAKFLKFFFDKSLAQIQMSGNILHKLHTYRVCTEKYKFGAVPSKKKSRMNSAMNIQPRLSLSKNEAVLQSQQCFFSGAQMIPDR